jgi:N-acetylmuramoyl-L-alanine amidase
MKRIPDIPVKSRRDATGFTATQPPAQHSPAGQPTLRQLSSCSFLLLVLIVFSFFFTGSGTVHGAGVKQSSASTTEIEYNKAKDFYYLLVRDTKLQADRQNWLKGIREFRRIYAENPKGELAPNCLFMIAKMRYRMYMRFHREVDLDESISSYNEVSTQFPENTLADDALFWTAEIYLKDKRNPRQAAKLYSRQIILYPQGDRYGQAASRLQDIKAKYDIDLPEKYSLSGKKKKLIKVLPVQYWSSDEYTRIVIRSSGQVRYKSRLLEKNGNQARQLLVDFAQSTIDPRYTVPIPVKEGLLQKVKSSQVNPTTVRVALDIESISTYQIFSLNDPFRVIVDVRGQQKILSASKTLPQVRREKIANPETTPELKPAGKKAVKGSREEREQSDLTSPFITLRENNKRKPGSTTGQGPPAKETGLTLAQQLGLGVRRIVIDPGHGGKDPGAMAHGLKEKDITLKVARKTAARLKEKYEYEAILTRSRDMSLPLEERTAIANAKKADLFVSIHVNAHPSPYTRGIETFYLNLATNTEAMRVAARENATTSHNISDMQDILSDLMQNSKIQESSILADYVQTSLIRGLREQRYETEDLGVKQAPFYVLIGAEMPAVLAEISFLSNKEDASRLRNEDYLDDISDQIAAGVAGYVNHQARAALQL